MIKDFIDFSVDTFGGGLSAFLGFFIFSVLFFLIVHPKGKWKYSLRAVFSLIGISILLVSFERAEPEMEMAILVFIWPFLLILLALLFFLITSLFALGVDITRDIKKDSKTQD